MSVEVEKEQTDKGKKKFTRYFGELSTDDNNDVNNTNTSDKSQNVFEGEVIEVEQNRTLPNKFRIHKNKFRKKLPISKEVLAKYTRGEKVDEAGVKTKYFKKKQQRKEIYLEYAAEQAARTELLLKETSGFIEPDEDEITADIRQDEIASYVDVQSASKLFKLNLQFGPYCMRYSKNGRHLLLGGRKGHVAAMDWLTKKLHCEMNVMEEVYDITYLHLHTMFACAQKDHVYFYDNQGTELHCVKALHQVNKMEFLPYHFLLATGNKTGYASWLDISIGEIVGNFQTRLGNIRVMRQNPANGVLCIADGKGVVSMWSPKVKKPLANMLVHATPISALCIDQRGQRMITAGLDRFIKVWDVRNLDGPLAQYKLRLPANQIDISQGGILAVSQGNCCLMYKNSILTEKDKNPYLRHYCDSAICAMRFCPYEDVLGVSTANGFQSLLVPGSGEANYDALEDNPYETRKQRKEREVHGLLEKIPPELITLNPEDIAAVDVPTLQEKIDARKAIFFLKPSQIDVNPRHKMKGKGGSAKMARNKQIVKNLKRKEFINQIREAKKSIFTNHIQEQDKSTIENEKEVTPSVLDRFKPKKKLIKKS